jgi:predicted dehydrogenase
MGQQYAYVYSNLPNTEVVAIAEYNDDRRAAVGERFGVKALYKDVSSLLKSDVPDIAAIITPTKYYKDAVIACAEAGVKGVSTDKPIAAKLSDADAMVETCRQRGAIYSGGNLQRASPEVQEVAKRMREGEFGTLIGAMVHGFHGEISGGGCQSIAALTLLANSRVDEVIAWGSPPEALAQENDSGLTINGRFHLECGLDCPVVGQVEYQTGLSLWSKDCLIHWDAKAPTIYRGFDNQGKRIEIEQDYGVEPYEERSSISKYLTNSINHLIAAVESGKESDLAISGDDLRHALEVAVACKTSAVLGSTPLKLPLEDRSLTLYPSPYRWEGGDATGRPQEIEDSRNFDPV